MVSAAMKESAKVGFGAPVGTIKITEAEQRRIDRRVREIERKLGIRD